jgi:hypothetical protein
MPRRPARPGKTEDSTVGVERTATPGTILYVPEKATTAPKFRAMLSQEFALKAINREPHPALKVRHQTNQSILQSLNEGRPRLMGKRFSLEVNVKMSAKVNSCLPG